MEQKDPLELNISVALLMLFLLSALVLRAFVQAKMVESGVDSVHAKHLSYLISSVMLGFLMWPVVLKTGPMIVAQFTQPSSWLYLVVVSVALGIALRIAHWGTVVARSSFGWLGLAKTGQGVELELGFSCPMVHTAALSIFVTVILTPVIEEVIHRGLIFRSLLSRGRWIAIGASAALFAVVHAPGTMPAAFVFGIIAALQTLNSGTLWPAIITHATYNLIAFVDWSCLHAVWKPEEVTDSMQIAGAIGIAVVVVFLVISARLTAALKAGAARPPRH